MSRVRDSANNPIDLCAGCFPTEQEARAKYDTGKPDGPDDRGNCFFWDDWGDDHPPYEGEDYTCDGCRKRLGKRDNAPTKATMQRDAAQKRDAECAKAINPAAVACYDEGFRAAVHGEPETVCATETARQGYRAACAEIKAWYDAGADRKVLPWYLDPEKCGPIVRPA